jgi:Tol biopolymer transport system component/tRNA A-37 threonylcarbamoyl transferase component Bud32
MIGETLRHYRIEAKLGAGGMGVVYRALDTHLDRSVAVKVLPSTAVANADRRARFSQEAKSASALSNRHIVTIFDIDTGQVDGQPVDFIAMEYVAGKTLDRLIGRKGIRLNDALRYAIQIADGLVAAHNAGIVHRDLKPANVIVNENGEVKILDFGLAKLTEAEEPDVFALTQSVHLDAVLRTEAGTIIGTVAYMSPEQADGHPVDARSDIFSFGAVLYEMATGKRAFMGDSKLSTLASVLHSDPVPPSQLGPAIPRDVERIISRCLRKDPQRRWQSMADIKVALEDVLEELEAGKLGMAAGGAVVVPPQRSILGLMRRVFLWPAVIVLALLAGVYAGWRFLKPVQPTFERLTYRRGEIPSAKFSPDGRTVVFSAQWANEPTNIFSMRPGSREYRPLDLPEGRILAISAAGEMAILLGPTTNGTAGTLARVPLSGGAPREILESVNDADWSPDGSTLAVSRTVGGKNRIEYPIGTVRYENDGRVPVLLRVSPKGDLIAFFEHDNDVGDYTVTVLDMSGKKRALSRGWQALGGLAWSPGGDEIWFGGAKAGGEPALRAVTLSGKERLVVETPASMLVDDIARDKKVLVTVVDTRLGISALAPSAKQESDLSWFDASRVYDISADGKTILFVELSYGQARNPAIYLRKTDGSQAVRLGDGNRPVLSPDGKFVACILNNGPQTQLSLLPTGPGEARVFSTPGMHYERVEWFPDGDKLLFTGNEPNRPMRTYLQDTRGGAPTPLTPEGMPAMHVSPDGKYLTAVVAGKLNLFPIAGAAPKPAVDVQTGEAVVRWSADGRSLFLLRNEGLTAVKISRLDLASRREEPWKELKPADPVGVQMAQVVMTPDGNAYAYSFQRDICTLYLADGLK